MQLVNETIVCADGQLSFSGDQSQLFRVAGAWLQQESTG